MNKLASSNTHPKRRYHEKKLVNLATMKWDNLLQVVNVVGQFTILCEIHPQCSKMVILCPRKRIVEKDM